jgi:hypothetical protein
MAPANDRMAFLVKGKGPVTGGRFALGWAEQTFTSLPSRYSAASAQPAGSARREVGPNGFASPLTRASTLQILGMPATR